MDAESVITGVWSGLEMTGWGSCETEYSSPLITAQALEMLRSKPETPSWACGWDCTRNLLSTTAEEQSLRKSRIYDFIQTSFWFWEQAFPCRDALFCLKHPHPQSKRNHEEMVRAWPPSAKLCFIQGLQINLLQWAKIQPSTGLTPGQLFLIWGLPRLLRLNEVTRVNQGALKSPIERSAGANILLPAPD